jgi:hypothetical protein
MRRVVQPVPHTCKLYEEVKQWGTYVVNECYFPTSTLNILSDVTQRVTYSAPVCDVAIYSVGVAVSRNHHQFDDYTK